MTKKGRALWPSFWPLSPLRRASRPTYMGKKGKGKKGKGKKEAAPDPNVLPNAIRLAVLGGDVSAVEAWLLGGGKVNAVNLSLVPDRGKTMLMLAARSGIEYLVNLLLMRGAAVNSQDPSGTTALMFAASVGHVSVMRRLLWFGANPRLGNYSGQGPLQWAEARGHESCVAIIKEVDPEWCKPVWLDAPPKAPPGPGIWAGVFSSPSRPGSAHF